MADVPNQQQQQQGIELDNMANPAATVLAQPMATPANAPAQAPVQAQTPAVQGPAQGKLIDIDNSVVDVEKGGVDTNGNAVKAPSAPESVASNGGLKEQTVYTAAADQQADPEFRSEADYQAFVRRERHKEYKKSPWKLLGALKDRVVGLKDRVVFKKPAFIDNLHVPGCLRNQPWSIVFIVVLCFTLALAVSALVAMAFVIKGSKNNTTDIVEPTFKRGAALLVEYLSDMPRSLPVVTVHHDLRGDFLDGTSGMLESHTVIDLVKDAVVASATTMTAVAVMANATLTTSLLGINATSTSILPVVFNTSAIATMSVADVSIPVVTPFLLTTTANTNEIDTATIMSSVTLSSSSSASTSSETCGEFGDGAGPCTRPYGHPNQTPATALLPLGLNASAVTAADVCNPTATIVITVTAIPDPFWTANATTIYRGTSTDVTLLTKTLSLTETAPFGNMTSSPAPTALTTVLANGTTATLSIANFTLTLGGGGGSSTSRADPASATIVVTSGGPDKVVPPKPLGATGTGSGVYCAVMLVAVMALLL